MATTTGHKTLSSMKDFEQTPAGWSDYWGTELVAADREVSKWHKAGTKIVDRFLDKRTGRNRSTRLNIFSSSIQTLRAMLYGQVPTVDVKRRDDDADDDVARVAANIMERMLNADVQREGDSYTDCLSHALEDRLLPGLGVGRVRYTAEFKSEEFPPQMSPDGVELAPGYTDEVKTWEDATVDYVHWKDVRWSPARVWGELRWLAFRSYLTKDEMAERFGEDVAETVPYTQTKTRSEGTRTDSLDFDPWGRCEVWEIWDKAHLKVFWHVKEYGKILDEKDDPLQLTNFWPCPRFLIANCTTSSFMPRADFTLYQDLYNEIDDLAFRIERIEKALKAVGVYNSSAKAIQRMMEEGTINDLIPVDNWASFTEQGGLAGGVQWMPLADLVRALDGLYNALDRKISQLFQLTGMSDIMRGQAQTPGVTATESNLKAQFGSVRVNATQESFADFAAGIQQLKAEVISRHFDDQTIIDRSNIMRTPDQPLVAEAMKLLRERFVEYRVEIMPDNISRSDYSTLKAERTEFISSVGAFINNVMPLIEKDPSTAPPLVRILQWVSAGFRAGDQIETVLDQAYKQMIAKAKQPQQGQQKQPSPEQLKLQTEQLKAKARLEEATRKGQARMAELEAKRRADQERLAREHQNRMAEIQADMQADIAVEQAQSEFNALEEQAKAEAGIYEAKGKAPYAPGAMN